MKIKKYRVGKLANGASAFAIAFRLANLRGGSASHSGSHLVLPDGTSHFLLPDGVSRLTLP